MKQILRHVHIYTHAARHGAPKPRLDEYFNILAEGISEGCQFHSNHIHLRPLQISCAN